VVVLSASVAAAHVLTAALPVPEPPAVRLVGAVQ